MSAVLLDTHTWIWYVIGSGELKKSKRELITTALFNREAHIAAISLWEIAMLENRQRITLGMPYLEWINKSIELTSIQIAPLTPAIAAESCCLPGKFHEDPADRMIVATARVERLTVMTRDSKILTYGNSKYITTLKV